MNEKVSETKIVDRYPQDICARCGLTWQTHLDAKAANCPFLADGEHLPDCKGEWWDRIALRWRSCSCRAPRGPAITWVPVGA